MKCVRKPDSGMEGLADRAPDKLVVESGSHPGEEAQVEQTQIVTCNSLFWVLTSKEEEELIFLPGVFGLSENPSEWFGNRVWHRET